MKRWPFFLLPIALTFAMLAGCISLDEKQRNWIFQPSNLIRVARIRHQRESGYPTEEL